MKETPSSRVIASTETTTERRLPTRDHPRRSRTVPAPPRFVYANEAFTTLTEHSRAETLAAGPGLLRGDVHPPSFYVAL